MIFQLIIQDLGRLRSRVAVTQQKEKQIYQRMFQQNTKQQQQEQEVEDEEGEEEEVRQSFVSSNLVSENRPLHFIKYVLEGLSP